MFSPVKIEMQEGIIEEMNLAPMAVLLQLQNQGIGTNLVKQGFRIIIWILFQAPNTKFTRLV